MPRDPITQQPILPSPVAWTETELNYADEEPPGFFPDNQDSNWGYLRKIFTDQMQKVIAQMDMLYTERFVVNSTQLLPLWEEEVGLPVNPALATIAQRRTNILNRLRVGPFTRERREAVVNSFFQATFGQPLQLLPQGVDLSLNPPLYSEATGPTETLFRVYEDVKNFSYVVRITSSSTPDIAALTRELTRITPAGISFTIVNNQAQILFYSEAVINLSPVVYWRLGGTADSGPYGYPLVPSGAPAVLAAPGLLNAAVAGGQGGSTFSAGNFFAATTPATVKMTRFTIGARIRPTTLTVNDYNMVWSDVFSTVWPFLGIYNQRPSFAVDVNAARQQVSAANALSINTTYSLVGTYDGQALRLYLDGILIGSTTAPGVAVFSGTNFIGSASGSYPFLGSLDEIFIVDRALSAAEILKLHNTAINVL